MQVRIEVELKPEELRRFLGLPDVAGLQEDLLAYLRDRVGDANEAFRPRDFVKSTIDTVKDAGPWRRFLGETDDEAPDAGKTDDTSGTRSRRGSRRRKRDEE